MSEDIGELLKKGLQDITIYEEFYARARSIYFKNVEDIIGDTSQNENLFSWYKNELTLHFVHRSHNLGKSPIVFATKRMSEKIIVYDAIDKTSNFLIRNKHSASEVLSELFNKDFFSFDSEEILVSSLYYVGLGVKYKLFADNFVQQEYNSAVKELLIQPIQLAKFNEVRIHMDLYNFEEMLIILNNNQFQTELLECIEAYNNQNFFVAAAGLGSVLEHLLYLILEKNNLIDRHFPRDPTFKDYISYMKKEPINLDHRGKTFIDSVFMHRNAISHYNTGFASKSTCDQMLQGIKNIFDNYYLD